MRATEEERAHHQAPNHGDGGACVGRWSVVGRHADIWSFLAQRRAVARARATAADVVSLAPLSLSYLSVLLHAAVPSRDGWAWWDAAY
eukprot:SAG31_NODE_6207_length_2121_cov_1.450049_1_plen_88_part_00